ncbi:MAG: glucose-1-phosphate thymidylyltransferase [Bdellovibrionales bacterium GWA2_49_15]|nr:MAG: glucose-1-phosphate thymidylyltransferase [Bdellovibrionales bacterium GWA2_49_15]
MKGIILAGGAGNRLYPLTQITTKQLQPVYDKPMIYYPLALLMLSGIKDILLITTEKDQPSFKNLLGDGTRFGVSLHYATQAAPKGISEAFIIGEKFIGSEDVALVLGDNLFYGSFEVFRNAVKAQQAKAKGINARVFAYAVKDPERYGVVEFDKATMKVLSIEEKPTQPKSNYAIPGFYLFDKSVVARALKQQPSARGELEITDLIKTYLTDGMLGVEIINRGMAWFDTGTPQSLLEASSFIGAIEQRQGMKVACLEEIALRMNFLTPQEFNKIVEQTPKSSYKEYLQQVLREFV